MLAREYGPLKTNLKANKVFGDKQDKALWEIICYWSDKKDPKWRDRAKLDDSKVSDAVLDLVPQRRKYKLKPSHLALYDAATRAGINFEVSQHKTSGKLFLTPSRATLLRLCKEGETGLNETINDNGKTETKAETGPSRAHKMAV